MRKNRLGRKTPLQRKKALKSMGGLAPGAPLARSAPLKQGKPLERRTPLRRGRWSRAEWERWERMDSQAHAVWKQQIVRRRCEMCVHLGKKGDASPYRDPHHILPARYIRRYVRGLRLPADEARKLLRSLLYDKRNGMSLDRRCHHRHETANRRVPREMIPAKAEQFARELGLEWVLDRIYGPKSF